MNARSLLDSLVTLAARTEGATLRLIACESFIEVRFKHPGKAAEVVVEPFAASATGVLRELHDRLRLFHDLANDPQDDANAFVASLNPSQKARLRAITQAYRDFKHDVIHGLDVASVEPHLAPPHSSLHPDVFTAAGHETIAIADADKRARRRHRSRERLSAEERRQRARERQRGRYRPRSERTEEQRQRERERKQRRYHERRAQEVLADV